MTNSISGYPIGTIAELISVKQLSEIMAPILDNMALAYAKLYKANGKSFVNSFIKYESVRMAISFTVNRFEKEVQPYEPDEKISDYVGKLKLDERQTRLLARTLKMIKLITE